VVAAALKKNQLPDLGNRDAAGLGFRAEKKEVRVTLGIGVKQVGGEAATKTL